MTNFKERLNPKIQTAVLLSACPYVIISKQAIDKMHTYTQKCTEEIGWLGTAYKHNREIYIEDTYLFDQEVHATTTEITPEGLADFASEVLQQENGVEIWNNLKMWGHSHVNMGISPSGQDDSQMATFKDSGHDWFIRLICNKQGELKVDFYDYTTGVIYLDLPWEEEICEAEQDLLVQIEQLQKQIDIARKAVAEVNAEGVIEEMKVKVRKKTYGVTRTQGGQSTTQKKTSGTVTPMGVSALNSKYDTIENYFESDAEVLSTFTTSDLCAYAEEMSLREVEQALWVDGYYDCFTDKDIQRVWRVAKQEYKRYGGKI